ncbi:UDP-glycosyltransferase, MGT [Mycolicibacterium canariasense]|uniref:UDP-glycosyltransferase, MGT n=1 Tax=Mycolicibacterium canariasense TaxID=228230 RepID=A0A100WFQ6_MYCCR|nr:nucleotide disphospho-sugar-binding domain-containing protein [Mycolicibacterium canariasense]MCV7210888.1 glycosyl transferase [Mycolicibacterium canariasense]ORV01553.1 glycosyl transferase [Mycolicibacterium canariasense]GAS97452.1 UDP-glycosyltransferase, MGT [Mycolicibacterium canariasense]
MTALTIMFWPESAYGPTNQCIGLAAVLRDRGHRIVFAAESSWAGKLAPFGFVEELVDLAEPAAGAEDDDPGKFWTDFIAETAPEFRKPTVEQLQTFIQPTYQALIDGAKYCEPRLRQIIATHRPDVIVEDNVVLFPALASAGVPFVRIVSCSPLEISGPDVPPPFSGLPSADRSLWDAYRAEYDRTHRAMWSEFNAWVQAHGAAPLPDLEFMPRDNAANLYVYPAEADYLQARPLDSTWVRMDSSVRETDQEYVLPAAVADRPDDSALIYLSLGSLGGADVELMQRLVDVLGTTRHRYIVSMGPQAERIMLADNMVGAQMLPQTKIIPQVDLVISHGGNNTVTETLHFGKPLVVLPLFWDQYENAQRIDELGFGIRLDTYGFADQDLTAAVERLLADADLRARLDGIGAAIRARDGLRVGADAIERVGLQSRPAS